MFLNCFRNLLKCSLHNNRIDYMQLTLISRLSTSINYEKSLQHKTNNEATTLNRDNNNEINWSEEMKILEDEEPKSVIEPITNDINLRNTIHPYIQPSFNFAAYVSKSETLQQLIHLGVDLHRIEKKSGIPQYLLKLDFDRDIKKYLQFFNDIGIDPNEYGQMITKNPLIFKENLVDLETRINYLESKTFKPKDIARICERNPFWLMFTTQRIDKRLGYFQQNFQLLGHEVRFLTVKQPKLITYNLNAIRTNTFSIREEMGFNAEEIKNLLLSIPKIWMMSKLYMKTKT